MCAEECPALLVVATPGDEPLYCPRNGIPHIEALLAITAAGPTSACLNPPVDGDRLRPRLREVAGFTGYPQLLLRIGRGPELAPAERQRVEEVIIA